MMDDSLADTVAVINANPDIADALERSVMPDKDMIAILKRRGYKVYPEKRVRIYSSSAQVDYRTLHHAHSAGNILEHVHERIGRDLGVEIYNSRAAIKLVNDNAFGKEFRVQAAVILPNNFDFEAEAWGIRR